jgi:MFS superfamily sulfate permease-like transporter
LAFGELSDPTTITVIAAIIVAVVIIIAVAIILFMRRRMQQPKQPKKTADTQPEPELSGMPFKIMKSVQTGDASHAKDELRILELERDILSDAIRRLYEAQSEGKITEQERERLAGTYKARMNTVKDSIAKDETIVALHELEGMQEDLMKLFSERFGELSSKVEELRTRIDVKPLKEIKIQLPQAEKKEEEEAEGEEAEEAETEEAEKTKKRKKPEEKQPAKTEAEQRVDEIRSEVERVLDKLGQMEIES